MSAAGLSVERHQDHFAPDATDEEWLEAVGKKGWIAVTHDQRIRYKPNERDAVILHRVGLFVVIGKAPYAELARAFVGSFKRIEAFLSAQAPPFIARVYRPSPSEIAGGTAAGRVELWYPKGP